MCEDGEAEHVACFLLEVAAGNVVGDGRGETSKSDGPPGGGGGGGGK
jgi:hypothetical protein